MEWIYSKVSEFILFLIFWGALGVITYIALWNIWDDIKDNKILNLKSKRKNNE